MVTSLYLCVIEKAGYYYKGPKAKNSYWISDLTNDILSSSSWSSTWSKTDHHSINLLTFSQDQWTIISACHSTCLCLQKSEILYFVEGEAIELFYCSDSGASSGPQLTSSLVWKLVTPYALLFFFQLLILQPFAVVKLDPQAQVMGMIWSLQLYFWSTETFSCNSLLITMVEKHWSR